MNSHPVTHGHLLKRNVRMCGSSIDQFLILCLKEGRVTIAHCCSTSMFLYYNYADNRPPELWPRLPILDIYSTPASHPCLQYRTYFGVTVTPTVIPNVVWHVLTCQKKRGTSVALQECGLQSTTFDNTRTSI